MRPLRHVAVLMVLIAAAFAMARNKISWDPYAYDEADYMFAATLGTGSNWLDTGSMPIAEFVSAGRKRGADSSQQAGLSALARAGADPVVYRHWHGPLYYFWLTLPSALQLDEHATRSLFLIFPVLTIFAIYFGSIRVLGGLEGEVAGILGSAIFLWSPVTLETSEVAPHLLFVLLYVSGLILLGKVALGGGRRFYYGAVVCAGLAFCTLEVAFVFILTLLFMGWWKRATLLTDWKMARNSLAIFVATVVVVWPAALFKLNFAKAYMVMAYLAVFRKGAWGDVTFAQTWMRRFALSPVEWTLIVAALILWIVIGKRRERAAVVPFLLFAGLMILAMLRVYTDMARYMTPFLAALDVFAGWVVAGAVVRWGRRPAMVYGAVAGICALLVWNAEHRLSQIHREANPQAFATLDEIRAMGLEEKSVLAPRMGIPTLHFYFPQMRLTGYADAGEIAGARTDAVIYPDWRVEKTASPDGK